MWKFQKLAKKYHKVYSFVNKLKIRYFKRKYEKTIIKIQTAWRRYSA
jgi:hypothetical protein